MLIVSTSSLSLRGHRVSLTPSDNAESSNTTSERRATARRRENIATGSCTQPTGNWLKAGNRQRGQSHTAPGNEQYRKGTLTNKNIMNVPGINVCARREALLVLASFVRINHGNKLSSHTSFHSIITPNNQIVNQQIPSPINQSANQLPVIQLPVLLPTRTVYLLLVLSRGACVHTKKLSCNQHDSD